MDHYQTQYEGSKYFCKLATEWNLNEDTVIIIQKGISFGGGYVTFLALRRVSMQQRGKKTKLLKKEKILLTYLFREIK